jgi:outer membrane protein assembly factor BamB
MLLALGRAVATPPRAAAALAPQTTPGAALGSATVSSVLLPGLIAPGAPVAEEAMPTPIGVADSPIATPTPTLNTLAVPMLVGSESPLATPTLPPALPPTATPTLPVAVPTETPTAALPPPTFTPGPPTPSATPTATGLPYVVNRLRAFVGSQAANVYVGPSTIYTLTGTLDPNIEVNLIGRNPSGEWVYVCCRNNEPVWARQHDVRPRDNVRQPGAPEDSDPNNVRWLSIQPAPSSIRTLPLPTPIPAGYYPLPVYSRSGSGRLPSLPNPPLSSNAWPSVAQAGQAFVSAPAVGLNSVVVGSQDNHLYSFDRLNGNQRWRVNLERPVRVSPIIYDDEIFVVDEAGIMRAFEDHGNAAAQIWSASAGQPPLTSFNVYSDTLFLAVGQGTNHQLLAVDRDNGIIRYTLNTEGPGPRYPVIGDQLIYVADGQLWARDVFSVNEVWTLDIRNITAGPVYSTPGVIGLAELYVVDGNNRIFCLDANTGVELWNYDNGERATALGVTSAALIVAGDGYVKAISRESVTQLWRAGVGGAVLGTPLSDAARVMVLTQGGNLTYLDPATGSTLVNIVIPSAAGGAAAVSEAWIYIPGTNGIMYAVLGSP